MYAARSPTIPPLAAHVPVWMCHGCEAPGRPPARLMETACWPEPEFARADARTFSLPGVPRTVESHCLGAAACALAHAVNTRLARITLRMNAPWLGRTLRNCCSICAVTPLP